MGQGQDGDDHHPQGVSRRGFLQGAVAGAALATGGGRIVGASSAQAKSGAAASAQASGGGAAAGDGDVALVNGKFVDGRGVVGSTISIRDGRIVSVGQPSGGGPGQTINLKGHTVIPGLIDAHVHFARTGTNVGHEARFIEVAFSIAELQEVIAERAATVPQGEFVTCDRGWTPLQFAEGRHATKAELDEAAPNHPVFLRGAQLGGATNSLGAAFFEARGVAVDDDGGISNVGAADAALRADQTFEDKVRGTADLIRFAAELGLTGIHDVGNVNTQPGDLPPEIVRADHAVMNALYHRNGRRLDTRVRQYLLSFTITPDELDRYVLNPVIREAGDEFLRVNGLGEQFSGSLADFEGALRAAARHQWRVQQHFGAPGNASQQAAAFSAVGTEFDLSDLRWSWGHAGTVTAEDMAAVVASGVGVTQTRGPARTWIDSGIRAGAATDATNVSWLSPWMQIFFFVTRRNQQGDLVLDGEQISRLEALKLYTEGSAWFSREDHELGSFEVGKKADLVVLDRDYLKVPDEDLRKTRSLLTLLGGRVVHAAGKFADLLPAFTQPFPDRFPESIEL